ncbi:PAS domain-containing protein [Cohnella lubricantis]
MYRLMRCYGIARRNLRDASALLASIDATVWLRDLNNRRSFVSAGIASLFGISQEEFQRDQQVWRKKVHPEDLPFLLRKEEELSEGKPVLVEFRVLLSSDSWKWVQARATPVLDSERKLTQVYGVLLDITERKRAEQIKEQLSEESRFAKTAIRTTLEIQETERKRIAKELHDGAGQSLYSVLLGLNFIKSELDVPLRLLEYMNDMARDLERMIQSMKDFSLALSPDLLEQLGLSAALEGLVRQLRTTQIVQTLTLDVRLSERLHPDVEINLYRIVQESLSNAMKHSRCGSILISIGDTEAGILLEVRDDGVGFMTEAGQRGLGLRHMEERARLMGGSFKIRSSPEKGTVILVSVPVTRRRA